MTVLSCLNVLNIALDTNERVRMHFSVILRKGSQLRHIPPRLHHILCNMSASESVSFRDKRGTMPDGPRDEADLWKFAA